MCGDACGFRPPICVEVKAAYHRAKRVDVILFACGAAPLVHEIAGCARVPSANRSGHAAAPQPAQRGNRPCDREQWIGDMAIFSLIYVSRSLIEPQLAGVGVDDIVNASVPRNGRMEITGSLIFTGTYFAQFLEGPRAGLADLMESIGRDTRHTELTVIDETIRPQRIFPNWSLAYVGPSTFVSRVVTRPIQSDDGASAESVSDLIALMRVFAENPSTPGSIFTNASLQ
jgi:hypothetical protein